MQGEKKASRNKTLSLSAEEIKLLSSELKILNGSPFSIHDVENSIIWQDTLEALQKIPAGSVDLVFADPPYNIDKKFNETRFTKKEASQYECWLDGWVSQMAPLLKPTASVYICGDWRSSGAIEAICSKYFIVRNRITWEREKGRGAKSNWKNCSEDIWFCTVSNSYTFNATAVKLKRKVIAPYRTDGKPKDWVEEEKQKYRLTAASNLWTDLTVPFWSMPENTAHPTQKPEKLLAKIILASSKEQDLVLDPFNGSGTTSVVAKKLGRKFIGIEIDKSYCLLAQKRVQMADTCKKIQGFKDGIFLERNSGF